MFVGWVKLHRETLEKAIWKCSTSEQKVIFITIIMLANHKHNQWIWKGQKFECQPGQFITSLKSLADSAEVSIKNVRTALLKFEKLEFLANESASGGRMITVLNWDRYQNNLDEGGKPPGKGPAKDRQTDGKASAPIKEGKKDKNDKNEINILIDGFNEITGRDFRGDDKTKRQLNGRLKEGYTIDEILLATKACFNSEYHRKNPQYLTPEFITRSDKLQQYLNYARIQDNQGEQQQHDSGFNPATGTWDKA